MNILRAMALVLLFVNLLLFAAAKGFFGGSGSGEPERIANQITPERIRIVEGGRPDPAAAKATASSNGEKAAKADTAAAAERRKADATLCRRFEPLSRDQAARLVAAVRRQNGRIKVHREPLEAPSSFWVYIPATRNSDEMDKHVGELKSAEISDWYLQPAGPEKGGISLGMYKQEAAANALRDKLRAKGITGVRVIPRESPGAKVAVEVTGKSRDLEPLMEVIGAAVPNISGRECSED